MSYTFFEGTPVGNITMVRELCYYDGPVIFICRDNHGNLYYCHTYDEIRDLQCSTYYMVEITEITVDLIEANLIDLRDVFLESITGRAFNIIQLWQDRICYVTEIDVTDIEWLPDKGVKLTKG